MRPSIYKMGSMTILAGVLLLSACSISSRVTTLRGQVSTDGIGALAFVQPECTDPECVTQAERFRDGAAALGSLTVTPGRDSVKLQVPAVSGAVDYRAFVMTAADAVEYSSGTESVTGPEMTHFCAGQQQTNTVRTTAQPLREIEIAGLTASSVVIVEALDRLCPFVGTVGPSARTISVTIDEVPVADRIQFAVTTEAAVRATYGAMIVNGHGAGTLGQPAPVNPPKVLARSVIRVAPEGTRGNAPMAYFDDFSNANDQPVFSNYVNDQERLYSSVPWNPTGTGVLYRNSKWNMYAFGFEHVDYSIDRGQLQTNLADWYQDIFASSYLTPRRAVQVSSNYLHVRFDVAENATQRRYWWFGLCGAETAGQTFNSDGTLKSPLVQTSFFYQDDGINPSTAGWNCLQVFPRDGYPDALAPTGKRPESDILVMLNKKLPDGAHPKTYRDSVVNLSPQQYYTPGDEARYTNSLIAEKDDPALGGFQYSRTPFWPARTWMRTRSANGTPNGVMLDNILTVGQKARYDLYISRNRLVLYVNGEQKICNEFGPHQLTMAEGAIALGHVLYHSAAERLDFSQSYNKRTGQRFYMENAPYIDQRKWDNVGFDENVGLPSGFDPSVCYTYGAGYR